MALTYMNARCKEILHMLLQADHYLTTQQIGKTLNISKRSFYYDLCRINEWLEEYGIPELKVVRGKGLLIDSRMKEQIGAIAEDEVDDDQYIFSPMERTHIIVCSIIYSDSPVYIDQLTEFCEVSRNTIFNDLRVVVSQLQDYNLELEYESKKGYVITGDAIKIRAIYLMKFHELTELYESGRLKFLDSQKISGYIAILKKIEGELKTKYVDGVLLSLAALGPLMERGDEGLYFPNLKAKEIEATREWKLIEAYFPQLMKKERTYLCLHLLGARVAVDASDIFEDRSNQMVYELTKALVAQFEKTACVVFKDKEELERQLFAHINSSLYRYQYGIQIGDSMCEDIMREYPDLFNITKIVSKYMEQQIGLPIPDSEIAYLALHFGAHLSIPDKDSSSLRILIVCANGVSTGNMLKREIQKMLPYVKVADVVPAATVCNAQELCDFIITTVRMKAIVPVIQVHPILTQYDRNLILNHPWIKAGMFQVDMKKIFSVMEPFIPEENRETALKALDDYWGKNTAEITCKNHPPGLMDVLDLSCIAIKQGEFRWTQALEAAGECLIEKKCIDRGYIDQIISQIRYYGPYMFITPRVIMAHAKPEDGVRHLGVSIYVFKDSVAFSDFHRANIVIILAAEDQERHLKILKDIVSIFSIQTRIDDLIQMEQEQEVWDYLSNMISSED